MEIKKFKKLKNNIYELELDNGSLIKLYDDVIVKYSLLINKKIDNKLLDEITKYNTSLDAYYLSLKYISKKLRCEKEIEKYLTKLDFNKDVIDKTISKLNKEFDVPFGENGMSISGTRRKYYLCESRKNLSLLKKLEK